MTAQQVIEVAAAAALFAAGIWLYRKRSADGGEGQYGSQGAVILFVIAVLLAIHGLGLLNYHPSQAELGQ